MIGAASTFAVLAFYVWTIFGLRAWVIGDGLTRSSAEIGVLGGVHAVLSFFVVFGSLVGGAIAGEALIEGPAKYALGGLVAIAALNAFNGLFELVTGVCPIYGAIHKRSSLQEFQVEGPIRRLGLIRLGISGLLLAGAIAIEARWGA